MKFIQDSILFGRERNVAVIENESEFENSSVKINGELGIFMQCSMDFIILSVNRRYPLYIYDNKNRYLVVVMKRTQLGTDLTKIFTLENI